MQTAKRVYINFIDFCDAMLHKEYKNTFDINMLKWYVLQKPTELITLNEFWNEVIQQLLESYRAGTARA
jgi:hypothetical protein